MKVTLIKPVELSAELIGRWSEIQQASSELASPFFAPTFTRLVANHRSDVEVAVIEEGSRITGFFPFQRSKGNHGKPVGWKINDYQGLILEPNAILDLEQLLRSCNLKSWKYDHMISANWAAQPFQTGEGSSPIISFPDGYDAYLKSKKAVSKRLKTILRHGRRLQEDFGDFRLVFHDPNQKIFQQTMKWKSDQVQAMNANNAYDQKWAYETVRDITHADEAGFHGLQSALYVDEHLIASHIGIRGENNVHWWIPTYNREFAKYSPGAILLLKMLEVGSQLGIDEIDLGKGETPYKKDFANTRQKLSEGTMTASKWQSLRSSLNHQCRNLLRRSQLAKYSKAQWIRARRLISKKIVSS